MSFNCLFKRLDKALWGGLLCLSALNIPTCLALSSAAVNWDITAKNNSHWESKEIQHVVKNMQSGYYLENYRHSLQNDSKQFFVSLLQQMGKYEHENLIASMKKGTSQIGTRLFLDKMEWQDFLKKHIEKTK